LRLGEEKKEEERRNRMKIYMVCPITYGDHKIRKRTKNNNSSEDTTLNSSCLVDEYRTAYKSKQWLMHDFQSLQ